MPAPSRNAPCPCGSGKKYKKCCLAKEEEVGRRMARGEAAVGRALAWLQERHEDAVYQAIVRGFFGRYFERAPELMKELPDDLAEALWINANEWLLAEGELAFGDGPPRRVAALLLGDGGPPLEAGERSWIEELAARPLQLWEVVDSRPGEGVWLRDALDPDAPRRWVVERLGSRTMRRGGAVGGRLLSWRGEWLFSGAIYGFRREDLPALRAEVEAVAAAAGDDAESRRRNVSSVLREAWIERLTAPPPRPEIVDAGSGDALLLTTDHYRVADWKRLAAVLAKQPDVEGDRKHGWARVEGPSGPVRRSLLALNPGRGDRLEVFARTRRLADEGREWLAGVAGDAIAFVTREISDPLGALGGEGAPPRRGRRSPPPLEKTTELTQAIYKHIYRTWADDPIPIFDGRSPRQMLRTAAGREQVADLLRSYEENEEQEARREKREPASFEFLWRAVGLEREG